MTGEDRDYFLSRAEAELQLAQEGTHRAAVRAHFVLAGFYLDKVYGPSPPVQPINEETARASAS